MAKREKVFFDWVSELRGPGKRCPHCEVIKPFSDFGKHTRSRMGLNCYCHRCMKCIGDAWKRRNPDKFKAHQAKSRLKNKEKNSARVRLFRQVNKEKCQLQGREWLSRNPDKRRATAKRWAKRNPEKVKEYKLRYNKAHPERVREGYRLWRKMNPEKVNAQNRRTRERKRKLNGKRTTTQARNNSSEGSGLHLPCN